MLKAFVVDDELPARDELIYLLEKTGKVEIAGEAESVKEALRKLEETEADVLFVDMMLTNEHGMDLVEEINRRPRHPYIVFATAYDEYAVKAFELNAVDYILKPFEEKRVAQTVDKMEKLLENGRSAPPKNTGKLAVTVDERIVIIPIEKLLYAESVEGRTMIATDNEKYTVTEPLVNVEKKLQSTSIVRVHRAYLVNLDAIVEIRPWFHSTYNFIMRDGAKIPVSRTYKHVLKQFIRI
ncbi:sensory transduction protein LytT [Weizmannia acidilactici]|uniref:Sensory transduction protein LytT n=1 Tax=Weizmannia acidilactici TaxID=2607726 RepID=A0A5J4JKB7_9BACI|nr:LytTR family transcriptional regulator DNA-binding domain-containing protein [Weizmannia acidilactici]GER71659.1 sensory transduction protein LytT [Weizmannia acidilactici]GER73984.1 sensory transduction protein LytT [Weizmannia acidilactici]